MHALRTEHHLRGGPNTEGTLLARPLDTPLPSPHKRNKLVPSRGVNKRWSLLLVRTPSRCSRGPNKVTPCLNFLSSLLSTSIDWGRPGTLVNNTSVTPGVATFHLRPGEAARTSQCSGDGRAGRKMNMGPQLLN